MILRYLRHHQKFGLLLLIVLTSSANTLVKAQPLIRYFERGEELIYEAEFSRSVLRNVDVADFRFNATRLPVPSVTNSRNNSSTLQFAAEIQSKGFFPRLFNVNFLQKVTSLVEPKTFAVQNTKRYDQQGKRIRSSETVYDHQARKVTWTEVDPNDPQREPRVNSSSFTGSVQDVLSAIYFLRAQPLAVGKTLQISFTDAGLVYNVPVRVVEKKRLKSVLGKTDTLLVDIGLFGKDRVFPRDGQLLVWLTADERHIPIKARVRTIYGTFDITLRRMTKTSVPG